MEQQPQTRWPRRAYAALFCGLLLLAVILPSTGGIIDGPPSHPGMWRCGPFLFHPQSFFTVTGLVIVSVGCIILGIKHRNGLETIVEIIGWLLMGTFFVSVLFGGH